MASKAVRPLTAFSVPQMKGARSPRTKLQVKSDRQRAADRRQTRANRGVWARDNRRCVRCGGPGWDVHHRMNKGSGGASSDLTATAPSRLMLVCRSCHDWIGRHVAEAEVNGWLIRHGVTSCADSPMVHSGHIGGLVLLTDDGQVVRYAPGVAQ